MRNATLGVAGLAAVAAVALVPGVALAQDAVPTFHKDIEPIFQRSCQV